MGMIDLSKRDKVVNGLKCKLGLLSNHSCRDCQYSWLNGRYEWECSPLSIAEDALAMLEEQAAWVMTKSELDDYISSFDGEARVWIEHRKLGLYCASLWSSNPSTGDKNFYDVMHECYFDRLEIGHWWRPWTSCPTKAQMEAVAWE